VAQVELDLMRATDKMAAAESVGDAMEAAKQLEEAVALAAVEVDADTAGRLHGVGMGGTRCRAGAGAHNQRLLHARLLPGTYALWLYLPTPKPAVPKPAAQPTTNFPDASVFTEAASSTPQPNAQAAGPVASLP
jgi:hypothetical protein